MMKNNKVALVGNMNNNFSAFTRYIKDEGFNSDLFLLNNDYFHPKQDSFDENWKLNTYTLDWGNIESFKKSTFKKIATDFSNYDFIIACGVAPAFFYKSGITIDVFIPYGSDLYSITKWKIVKPIRQFKRIQIAYYQKKGIKNSHSIFMAPTGGILEKCLREITPEKIPYKVGVPMLYHKMYDSIEFDNYKNKSDIYHSLIKLKRKNKKIIFHNCRHVWESTDDFHSIKRNDYLFIGFKALLNEMSDETNYHIVTFEYGIDVTASKKLVNDLGLENYVTWLPKSDRKDVMIGMSISDIIVGELFHSSFSYGIIYEGLAMKKIIIHKREDHLYNDYYEELYPMLYADSAETIKEQLLYIHKNPNLVQEMGANGHDWFLKHMVKEPLVVFKHLLNNKKS